MQPHSVATQSLTSFPTYFYVSILSPSRSGPRYAAHLRAILVEGSLVIVGLSVQQLLFHIRTDSSAKFPSLYVTNLSLPTSTLQRKRRTVSSSILTRSDDVELHLLLFGKVSHQARSVCHPTSPSSDERHTVDCKVSNDLAELRPLGQKSEFSVPLHTECPSIQECATLGALVETKSSTLEHPPDSIHENSIIPETPIP